MMSESRFVEEVHEFHCLPFKVAHDAVDARSEVVVGKERKDSHHQTGHRGNQRLIYPGRKHGDVRAHPGGGKGVESLYHAHNSSEEAYHRRTCGRGGKPREALPERGHFHVAGVLDGNEHIVHRPPYPAYAFQYETRIWGVGLFAERGGAFDVAFMDIVAYAVHESAVFTGSAAYDDATFHEDVDAHYEEQRHRNHKVAAVYDERPESE